jgi:hypothetical protein
MTQNVDENPELLKEVTKDTPLKEWLVNYVGEKEEPEDKAVNVEMIVKTIAEEFPEFLLVVAEENFIRGYKQALNDVESGENLLKGLAENNEKVHQGNE